MKPKAKHRQTLLKVVGVALTYLCLLSCANQPATDTHSANTPRWSGFVAQQQSTSNAGHYEYNGIGGSGKQPLDPFKSDPQTGGGIGGSGVQPTLPQQANGMGGSGRHGGNAPIENGLGGSGKQGDKAAIFGAIRKFGSIWVNDRHILLPESTDYFIAGTRSTRNALRLGQMVAVMADHHKHKYHAIEVHMVNNVVGTLRTPVISLSANTITNGKANADKARYQLEILGQRVLIDANSRIEDINGQRLDIHALAVGQRLAVSGIRTPQGDIQASLMVVNSAQPTLVAGPVRFIDGQYYMAGQVLVFPEQTPVLDQPLTLKGALKGEAFAVDQWQPMPYDRLLSIADEIWLEGFPMDDAELFLDGYEVQMPDFIDDLFDPEDAIRIGIDVDEQTFWLEDALEHDWDEQDWHHDDWDELDPEYHEEDWDEDWEPEYDPYDQDWEQEGWDESDTEEAIEDLEED